jgi:hypothetical protein
VPPLLPLMAITTIVLDAHFFLKIYMACGHHGCLDVYGKDIFYEFDDKGWCQDTTKIFTKVAHEEDEVC